MKCSYYMISISLVISSLQIQSLAGQTFFSGAPGQNSSISRTGSTMFSHLLIRGAKNGVQVMENVSSTGHLYIRSVGYQVIGATGNVIINDIGGLVGIGTSTPKEKLSVNGNIRAKEIKVESGNWPDYVFNDDYELTPLNELYKFITVHGHLPKIPSAKIVEDEGVSLGEMNRLLLEKVEEITLHLIEKDKEILNLQSELKELRENVSKLL